MFNYVPDRPSCFATVPRSRLRTPWANYRRLLHGFCRVFGGGRNGVEPTSVWCQVANGTSGSPAGPGVDHGAICPMFDLGVAVTIAHPAGVVVIGGGNINPGNFAWDFEKIPVVDAPRVLID